MVLLSMPGTHFFMEPKVLPLSEVRQVGYKRLDFVKQLFCLCAVLTNTHKEAFQNRRKRLQVFEFQHESRSG